MPKLITIGSGQEVSECNASSTDPTNATIFITATTSIAPEAHTAPNTETTLHKKEKDLDLSNSGSESHSASLDNLLIKVTANLPRRWHDLYLSRNFVLRLEDKRMVKVGNAVYTWRRIIAGVLPFKFSSQPTGVYSAMVATDESSAFRNACAKMKTAELKHSRWDAFKQHVKRFARDVIQRAKSNPAQL